MREKRSRVITLRVTEQEYFDIFCEADEYGKTISEFVRDKAVPKYHLV